MSVSYFEIHNKDGWIDGQRGNRKTRWRDALKWMRAPRQQINRRAY